MTRETAIVLDTNVVLDWLIFRDPRIQALSTAIERGEFYWLATPQMRDELAHVLAREPFASRQPDQKPLWALWKQHATLVDARAALTGDATRVRCTDPDDQKFIDLALASASWLISRDRAVLKLARKAALLGVQVLTPERWALR